MGIQLDTCMQALALLLFTAIFNRPHLVVPVPCRSVGLAVAKKRYKQ